MQLTPIMLQMKYQLPLCLRANEPNLIQNSWREGGQIVFGYSSLDKFIRNTATWDMLQQEERCQSKQPNLLSKWDLTAVTKIQDFTPDIKRTTATDLTELVIGYYTTALLNSQI